MRHSQTNRESERTNASLQQYLHCYVNYQQEDWVGKLGLAEFAYNNTVNASTQQTPFLAYCGRHPEPWSTLSVPATKQIVGEMQALQELLRGKLNKAIYKKEVDESRRWGGDHSGG